MLEVDVSRHLSPSSSRTRTWEEASGSGATSWGGLAGIDWPIGFPAAWVDGCWGSDIIFGRGWLRDEGDPIRKGASPVCRVFITRSLLSYKVPGLAREESPPSSSSHTF